jgi:hypothetical protein
MAVMSSLLSSTNHVEVPFIIVKIGNYTFGHCEKVYKDKLRTKFELDYPNFLDSLSIVKVNGAVNTYTLTLTYAITQEDDPNFFEKVFSSISNSRTIILQYGDWNSPSFIYKEEEAIITKLTTKATMSRSTIQYVINCTSNSLNLKTAIHRFGARKDKPSNVIRDLLNNKTYGLLDVFPGMRSAAFENFVACDDKEVQIEAKSDISVFDYISYLVSCMVFSGDKSKTLKTHCYFWSAYDDISNKYGGTYFKVVKVAANTNLSLSYNTYEVDVGYPTDACITDFTVNNDDSWAILYNYAEKVSLPTYSYRIDNSGSVIKEQTNSVIKSTQTHTLNESTRNWWSLMTQFPITATLTMGGLLRPAMLMSYVKVNVYFYGKKHVSSGLYIITKQEDVINSAGYRTTLSLTRVGGDEEYVLR